MAVIKPFKALRPQPGIASGLASRPYDVLNRAEALQEAEGNPYSFYHISKAEIDLPAEVDIHDESVYEKARENLHIFQKENFLFVEEKPCYYIYQLTMNGKSQTGLVAVSSVLDYENEVIKKHELTRPEKEQDRINHILTTRAQTGNVFLAYRTVPDLQALISHHKATHESTYDFTADDGIGHRLWIVDSDEEIKKITELFSSRVSVTYIADGHHRAASAAKAAQKLSAGKYDPASSCSFFLTTLFPDNELQIIDYNRLVKDLNGLGKEIFLSRLEYDFEVTKVGETRVKPAESHEFGMYLDGNWYKLAAKENTDTSDVIGRLDVSILQNKVLDKLLGIKNPRTDNRVDFVGGIRGLKELEQRVNSGEMTIAFALHPVTMEQLFEVADAGKIMPPKSTWFEPKLRDGLLTHLI